MSTEKSLAELVSKNEALTRRVEELELALESLRRVERLEITPKSKFDPSLTAFVRLAVFPIIGGIVRLVYRGVYGRKKKS